jgi:type I restriction enzyme S subunit
MLVMGMSSKKHQIPAIRFKGFTDAWEQRKLGDIADIKDSARISNELWVENGIPYLRSSDLVNGELNGELFISKETYEGYASKTGAPQKDDVLFTSGGKVGVVYHKKDESPVYVQGGAVLYVKTSTSNLLDGSFLSIYFGSPRMQTYMDIASSGGTIKHFTLKPANASPIIFPGLSEQQKIGAFFKELDKTIALHQRQLDNYKQLKKSMKQKIFDQKLRFKDADGNDYPKWKRRTLGEISEIIMGQSPDSANYTSNEQDTVLIQGNADLNGGRITPRIYTTQITKTCEAGDIILTVRAPVGDLAIANTRACIGRGVCAIKGDLYIYQYLEMIRDTDGWRKIIQGSTFESINSNDVKDLPIDVPSSEERKKIAEFFKALDRRIEKSTQRVESMKQFRKGLMQQMFVE